MKNNRRKVPSVRDKLLSMGKFKDVPIEEDKHKDVSGYMPILAIAFGIILLITELINPEYLVINWFNCFIFAWAMWVLTSIIWWLDGKR